MRRAGPESTPKPVSSPVKSAIEIVPAVIRFATTKSSTAIAIPISTSISGAMRARQMYCLTLSPSSRSKTPSALRASGSSRL